MAWIESHQQLAHHPKVERLARLIGEGVPATIGHLHLLWWWAMDYAPDGDLDGYEPADIAAAALYVGDANIFWNALCSCGVGGRGGFVDGGRYIHDWYDFAGKLIVWREKDAERKKIRREAAKKTNSRRRPPDIRQHGVVTEPNRTEPNQPKKNPPPFGFDDREYGIARLMRECILKHSPQAKVPIDNVSGLRAWARDADLMLRLDKRPVDEVRAVIAFATIDDFWHRNILSVGKLRKKYDQLILAMKPRTKGDGNVNTGEYAAPGIRVRRSRH